MKNNPVAKVSKKTILKCAVGILLTVIVFYCSVALIKNTADISRLNSQYEAAQVQYEQQIKENNKAKAILNSDDKNAYIEQKAREKGYVKDGEVVFYDVSS
ncbi:MAG: septum formation initiator family protein [Eubacterium sp.]